MPAPVFPAFVELNMKRGGSAKATFLAEIASMTQSAEQQFKASFSEINRVIDDTLSKKRNASGSLDLGVDEMRAAAAAQQARAIAAREVATATAIAAKEQGDLSQKTYMAVKATEALAVQEERAARQAVAHAQAVEQVQEVLNRQKSQTEAVIDATRRGTEANHLMVNSTRSLRVAMVQSGQQLQDVAISLYSGQRAGVVFAQQLPQLAFALSGLEGSANKTHDRIGRFATFLSGPWGLAVGLAVGVLGTLVARLFEAGSAAEENAKAMGSMKLASDGLSGAQSALGDMFDLVTGKLSAQNDMLRLNVQLTAIKLRAEASAEKANATSTIANFSTGSLGLSTTEKVIGALGIPVRASMGREQGVRDLVADLKAGKISPTDAVKRAEGLDFSGLAVSKTDFMQAVSDSVSAPGKESIADKIEKSLTSGVLDPSLRKTKTGGSKSGSAKSGSDLTSQLESAAEAVKRITEQFDEQPKFVDKVVASTRTLDAIISEMSTKKPGNWEQVVKDAEAAKEVIQNGFTKAFDDLNKNSERSWELQQLSLQGRDAEVEALQNIWSIEDRIGSEDELRKKQADLIAKGRTDEANAFHVILDMYPQLKQAEMDRAALADENLKRLQRAKEIQSAYLDASRSIRGELEAMFAGNGSFANLGNIFKQLNSKIIVEKLFGNMFEDVDKWIKKNTGQMSGVEQLDLKAVDAAAAIDRMAASANRAAGTIGGGQAGSLEQNFDATFGSKNVSSQWDGLFTRLAAANDNKEIVVTGVKASKSQTIIGASPAEFMDMMGQSVGKAFTSAFGDTFNSAFFAKIGGALGGAFTGMALTGSPIGAGLGLLSSIPGLGGKTGIFGKALGGMVDGSQFAMMSQLFGLGGSSSGAGIGGAIGSLLPIPGGSLIGSAIGSIFGGKGGLSAGKAIGGIAGGVGGYMLGSSLAAGFGPLSMLGSFGGPVGAVVGLVLGSLLGGLFKAKPKGSGSISNTGFSVSANNDGISKDLNDMGSSVASAIDKIGQSLGVTPGAYNFSFGKYRDWYQVSNIANDPLIGGPEYWQKSSNEAYDGKDQAAAIAAAIKVAINQGAFKAIGPTANRILSNGAASGNLDAAVSDAKAFVDVMKEYAQVTDPLGYNLDLLNEKFAHLRQVFIDNGASAEEYAKLEKLYGIQRTQAIEQANQQVIGSLKSLYEQLTIGDSGLSIRDRLGNAMGALAPLTARVKAGDTTAYDSYASAAGTALDLQRQMYGSQDGYWSFYNQVRDLSGSTIDAANAKTALITASDSPFSKSTTASNDNQGVIDALGSINGNTVINNKILGEILNTLRSGGGSAALNLNSLANYF